MPKFLTNINMNGNEIQNFRIQSLATDPSNPNPGQIWFNSTEKRYKGYNGTEIVDFGRELSGEEFDELTYQLVQEFERVDNQFDELNYRLDWEFGRIDDQLANKSDKNHNHALASLSERSYNSLTDKPTLGTAASRNVGTSEGNVPILGAGGKLSTSVLPPLAIGETFVVNSESAMIALNAQRGDVAVRTDLNKTFILSQEPASSLSNWVEMLATGTVVSVNGKTGAVSLTKSDVGLGNVQNYGIATQAEAEAGTSSTKYMTPQRTSQAITALSPVKSVNNRTGEVYLTADEIPTGGSIGGTVLTALEGLTDWVDGLRLEKPNKYAANIGNGSDTEFTITHGFGTKDMVVGIEEVATGEMVFADVIKTSNNVIKVMFAQPPSTNQYRVTIIG